jgi:hypothetical protein
VKKKGGRENTEKHLSLSEKIPVDVSPNGSSDCRVAILLYT